MAAPAAVPMEQVLPVLLSALPLKTDRSENEAVYTCLLGLIHLRHTEAMRSLDAIMGELGRYGEGGGTRVFVLFVLLA